MAIQNIRMTKKRKISHLNLLKSKVNSSSVFLWIYTKECIPIRSTIYWLKVHNRKNIRSDEFTGKTNRQWKQRCQKWSSRKGTAKLHVTWFLIFCTVSSLSSDTTVARERYIHRLIFVCLLSFIKPDFRKKNGNLSLNVIIIWKNTRKLIIKSNSSRF